jgi:hypothetical protein
MKIYEELDGAGSLLVALNKEEAKAVHAVFNLVANGDVTLPEKKQSRKRAVADEKIGKPERLILKKGTNIRKTFLRVAKKYIEEAPIF